MAEPGQLQWYQEADHLHDLMQACPRISLEASPSEAADRQSAEALGADSGSAGNEKGMVASHVQAIRRRAAAMEKSIYFMEKRQDSAASLPSETARHASQLRHDYMKAMKNDCPEKAARVKEDWKLWKTNLLYSRYSHVGCFGALYAAWYYRL
jgi:hypothetical protein